MFVFVVVFVFASDGSIDCQIVSLFVSVFASICMWISCCICVFIGQYMHFNQFLYLCLYWPVLVFELVFVYVSVFASNCFWNFVYNNSVGQWWICWLYLIAEKSNKMCSFRFWKSDESLNHDRSVFLFFLLLLHCFPLLHCFLWICWLPEREKEIASCQYLYLN